MIFTALAELAAREIAKSVQANGLDENADAGKKGGRIARKARIELEQTTAKGVVTYKNFLAPAKPIKKIKDTGIVESY